MPITTLARRAPQNLSEALDAAFERGSHDFAPEQSVTAVKIEAELMYVNEDLRKAYMDGWMQSLAFWVGVTP